MNARAVQAALQGAIGRDVSWTSSGEDGYLYIGDEDNVDAVVVIGPFRPDAASEVDAVDVGLNGGEHQERLCDTDAVLDAVLRLTGAS